MKKEQEQYYLMGLVISIIFLITLIVTMIAVPFMVKSNDEIVESYESGLDKIAIDFDDDKLEYDVFVFKTEKHYFVKLEDVVVIPFTENEAYIEITKSGKCKLYFFIKWEVEK